ncbi:hypothetical protein ES703_17423 [subsurface metagenome]
MVYEVKREEVTQEQWQEMKKIASENVCGICGAELQIHTNPERGTIEVGCLNREHHGYIERTTYTQEFRRGEEIHPAIRDKIEKRMILPGGQPVGVALAMIQTRFPRADMDEPSAALFLWDCVRLDLDPLLGEIFPATFKVKGKDNIEHKVVQPIISEDGWLSLAARACPEDWAGPPRTMRLEEYLQTQDAYKEKPYTEVKEIAKEIKADLCKDPEAYVWVAVGHRKDQEDTIGYGWYKKSEEGVVAKNLPGNQARVRAIKRWVREVFPEAKAKMKEMTATWMERAGDVRDIQNVIEAEYHIVTEEPPKGREELTLGKGKVGTATLAPAAESADQGEDFNIDLQWLKEAKQTLKWTDDTMLTFIISQYKVSDTSVTGALNKLTREQAEEFVKEIQSRLEKQQASLF